MPRLFVLSGDDLGRTYDFDRAIVLGRGDTADMRLRSASVSRHHARVEPDPATGGWRVVDLDSRNGLAVNGRKVPAAPLTEGGVFSLGDIELRFRAEGAPLAGPPIVLGSQTGAPTLSGPPTLPLDDGELELEGDWSDVVPPPPTAGAPRPGSTILGAPSPPDPRRAPTQASAPSAAQRERDARRAELLRGTSAGTQPRPSAAGATAGTRPVLQYHRTEGSGGLLGADLAQRPWWVRAGVWLIGLGLLAGLGYGAMELTRKLRAGEASLAAPDAADGVPE